MADNDNHMPDSPANWEQYSRALRNLPERPLPPGFDGRLQAALSEPALRRHHRVALWRRFLIPTCTAAILVMIFWFGSAWPSEDFGPPARSTPVINGQVKPAPERQRQRKPAPAPAVTQPSNADISAVSADSAASVTLPLDTVQPTQIRPQTPQYGPGPSPGPGR